MSYRDKIRLIAVREQLGIARRALQRMADGDELDTSGAATEALDEIEQIEMTRLFNPAQEPQP